MCAWPKSGSIRHFVFEMYADVDAYKAHLETAHFKKYKAITQSEVSQTSGHHSYPAGAKSM